MGWIAAEDLTGVLLAIGIFAAVGLNAARLAVWTFIHHNYSISGAYPISSLFFPALAVMEWHAGAVIELHQWAGVLIVTCGVFWIAFVADSVPN